VPSSRSLTGSGSETPSFVAALVGGQVIDGVGQADCDTVAEGLLASGLVEGWREGSTQEQPKSNARHPDEELNSCGLGAVSRPVPHYAPGGITLLSSGRLEIG
jgi:hypothetical protein